MDLSETFHFGSFDLLPSERELRFGGAPVAIGSRAFDLLVALVRRRGRLATKEDLLTEVWAGRIIEENNLQAQISALRKILAKEANGTDYLRTVPGRGYRFYGKVEDEQLRQAHDDPAAPTVDTPALLLPNRPSIAILPFTNMSGDSEQEYFADGIVEDITTKLSRFQDLFVIALNSSFTYKGRAVDVKQIGRELGVRYLLEGSVRRGGNRFRVTAQLLEAETGIHLSAERYDRELADIFAVQDEITETVVAAVGAAVADRERRRVVRKAPESLGAWEAYQRGLWHQLRMSSAENEMAETFFRRAIDLDPTFAAPHALLAGAIFLKAALYGTMSIPDAVGEVLTEAEKAISLDPMDARGHVSMGWALFGRGDHEGMLAAARQALTFSPNLPSALRLLGCALLFSGKPKEGLDALHSAIRLDPRDRCMFIPLIHITVANYFLKDYGAAIASARQALRLYPAHPQLPRWLAAALAQAGHLDEARKTLQSAVALAPNWFDMAVRQRLPWMRPEDYEHMLEGLRKAGWDG
jgi:adenylate cyclase